MNDQRTAMSQPTEPARGESSAVRDAVAGLTGTLGIEVYAWQLEIQRAVQYAEIHAATPAHEQAGAALAAQGEA